MTQKELRYWANVAKSIGGETRQVAGQPNVAGKMTPAEAESAMAEIRARPEYWDATKNLSLRHRMDELARVAYGD
jgi:hypothetical protein